MRISGSHLPNIENIFLSLHFMRSLRMAPRAVLVLILALLSSPGAVMGQVPQPAAVPSELSEQERTDLFRQRSTLLDLAHSLEQGIQSQKSQCGHVDTEDAGRIQFCQQWRDQLRAQYTDYVNKLRSYEQDRLNARNREIETTTRSTVARERDEFDRMNQAWLRAQEELIRQSVNSNRAWRRALLESLQNIQVPPPAHRPRSLNDLLPGDVLLFAPEQGWSEAIPPADYFYRVASDLARGEVHAAVGRRPTPVSHALAFVKQVNGVMLFLDHTHEGSRILDGRELARKYKNRKTYVARPETVTDGKLLWAAAKRAALRNRPYFGVLPGQLVCSEQACATIARASGSGLGNNRLGPIDITPGDFFDPEATGKYFIVSPLER